MYDTNPIGMIHAPNSSNKHRLVLSLSIKIVILRGENQSTTNNSRDRTFQKLLVVFKQICHGIVRERLYFYFGVLKIFHDYEWNLNARRSLLFPLSTSLNNLINEFMDDFEGLQIFDRERY